MSPVAKQLLRLNTPSPFLYDTINTSVSFSDLPHELIHPFHHTAKGLLVRVPITVSTHPCQCWVLVESEITFDDAFKYVHSIQ